MIPGVVRHAGRVEPMLAVRRADRWWERLRGLLGTRAPLHTGLYIAPCSCVHTAGMRYPIDVAFLDRGDRVLRVVEALAPWRLAGAWGAHAVLECAVGTLRRHEVAVGDRLEWRPDP